MAVLGLHYLKLFFSRGERGLHLVAMCRFLIAKVSLVERGLSSYSSRALEHRLRSCGTWA